ncbi:hypothetical protein ABT332_13255 [Saccharomonospora azurea]|uniref:hypothetical protein n=1 Tax=Saccharomonospora azurea TaxID=40988 RepID=UPI00332AD837
MTSPRTIHYLVNHGLDLRRANTLARAGFSTVAELDYARALWQQDAPDTPFGGFLDVPRFGAAAGTQLLEALDNYAHDRLVDPPKLAPAAAQYRDRVLSGEIPHGTPLGTCEEFAEREGLAETAASAVLRWLEAAGWVAIRRNVLVAIHVDRPYRALWSVTIPASARTAVAPGIRLMRHNPAIPLAAENAPTVRALMGIELIQWNDDKREIRVLDARTPRDESAPPQSRLAALVR